MKVRHSPGACVAGSLKYILVICMTALPASNAFANETASAIRGMVTDGSGAGISGATVTVISETTSLTRTVTTNTEGGFTVRNLPTTGSYSVTVNSSGYSAKSIRDVRLVLGETTNLILDLASTLALEELVVTGTRVKTQVAVGPSAAFDLEALERAPAINRNIADVIREALKNSSLLAQ